MLSPLHHLAQQVQALQQQTLLHYTPIVQQIIDTKTTNEKTIEHTLDNILEIACTTDGLALYKKLCRYYWHIHPQATADYINRYREMWEDETIKNEKDEE
jgi:hypothetical protein